MSILRRFMNPLTPSSEAISWRGFAALLALLLAVVIGVGVWLHHVEEASADHKAHANLEAIARLKVDQIVQWRGERLADAVDLMSSSYLIEAVERWFDHPNDTDLERITRRLRTLVKNKKLLDVMLVDATGKLRLNFASQPDSTGNHLQGLASALRGRHAVLGDLHQTNADIALDAFAPLVSRDGRTLGAIVLHNNAATFLFPMLSAWPITSRTGETVLVRRDGDSVLFLNKLRHRPDAAFTLRMPLGRNEIPAVRAVLGQAGVYEGPDHRGVPVLSVLQPIPGSPWFMVAKLDVEEAYADWYKQSRLLLSLFAGIAALGAGGLLWLRYTLARNRALLRAETAQRDSERQADLIIDNAADGILVTGADGRIKRVNPRAEALFGYPAAELIGQEVEFLIPERLRQTHVGQRAEYMVEPNRREMRQHGTGLPMVARRRDGSEFPFEAGLVPMLLEGERQVVVTLRDITLRRTAEAQLQQDREQQTALRELLETILAGDSLKETLTCCLKQILAVPWLALLPKGAIHLMAEDGEHLALSVSHNQPAEIFERCGHLPLGCCLCGQAAATREVVFAAHVDECHEISYPGMIDHGHYCLPLLAEGRVLGVLVLQLPAGAARDTAQEEFLKSVTHILAAYIARMQGEQALKAQESMYRLVAETAGDGFWLVDTKGRLLEVNEAYIRLSGYSREELLGMYVWQLDAMETPEDTAARMQQCVRDGRVLFLSRHRCKDGRLLEMEISASWCNVLGGRFFVFHRDVTARSRAEETLRKLSSAVEQSSNAILMTNQRVETDYVNAAFVGLTGYSLDDIRGKNPSLLQSGETPPEIFTAMWNQLRQGQSWRGEVINRRRNGETYYAYQSVTPIANGAGEISHYVSISEDISEKKRIGRELDQHRHHLEDLVAIRTSELVLARLEAERLVRVKSEFLANMSHEIRAPMNAVLGMARIGLRDSEGRVAHETFGHILQAGAHLLGVINDILDFSKIEAGKMAVEARPFKLAASVAHVLDLTRERADAKGLALTLAAATDLPDWVAGDRLRLEQVLLNLLGNAVKFTAHGEVSLNVRREGEDTLFRVADSGIGMTPEQVSRLFSAFEQADSSTTRQFGGSGLGLAISRNLAHLMGGDIGVTSEMGNGSVFTLQLPLPTATPQKKAEIAVASGPRLAGLRVLAAEDVELNRLVLEDFLEHEGASVVFAENGQQALDRLAEHGVAAFDVVLMDVQMPVMDGHEATRRLRAIAPNLPVIGLTAHALAEERDKCLASGMVEHVGKPIEPDELIGAILRQVGGWVASVESAASAAVPAAEASSSLIDWAALNERFNNRTAFIDKLLATVLKDHAPTPVNLRLAIRTGDFKTLAFLAHSLKGLTGSLSAQAIYVQSRTAEDAARLALENAAEETLEVARQAAEILAEQMDALLQEITLHLEPPANDLPEATA